MIRLFRKKYVLSILIMVWVVLWMVFLVREDKDGQYKSIAYMYAHKQNDRISYSMGRDLYNFLRFTKGVIPERSTYKLTGFEKFSKPAVHARYFLWPMVSVPEDPDYIIMYGGEYSPVTGYEVYREYGSTGILLKRGDRK
ncbi:MAG: hypothetical protein ABH883_01870 [Candidatus Omnitrophota bacterium]